MQRACYLGLPPQGRGANPRASRKGSGQFRHGCIASVARRVSGQLYRDAFTTGNYWSSTENSSNNAWNQRFSDGNQNNNNKDNTRHVRAVRR